MAITKAYLEQILVELAPIPKLMGDMSDRITEIDGKVDTGHESQVRTEEAVKATNAQLDRINGNITKTTELALQNKQDIAVLCPTVGKAHTDAETALNLSRDNAADIRWFKIIAGLGGIGGISSMVAELIRAIK